MKHLLEIDLSNNAIEDIRPIGELESLEIINLNANRVTDIEPLMRLGSVERISLRENPELSCDALRSLVQLLGDDVVRHSEDCADSHK